MATYNELHALRGSSTANSLKEKIAVSIAIKANAISKLATPTDKQKEFSVQALANPNSYMDIVFNYILAEYNTLTTAQIIGAADAAVQTAVDNTVDTLLGV